jgi:hypothetical protein
MKSMTLFEDSAYCIECLRLSYEMLCVLSLNIIMIIAFSKMSSCFFYYQGLKLVS